MQNVHEFLRLPLETSKSFHAPLCRFRHCPSKTPGGCVFTRLSRCLAYFSGKVWEAWNQRMFAVPSHHPTWAEIMLAAYAVAGAVDPQEFTGVHHELFRAPEPRSCSSRVYPSATPLPSLVPLKSLMLWRAGVLFQVLSHAHGNLLSVWATRSCHQWESQALNRVGEHLLFSEWRNKGLNISTQRKVQEKWLHSG